MNFMKLVLISVFGACAACSNISLPVNYNTKTSSTPAELASNFTELANKGNACNDSTDEVRGRMSGYTGDFTITSMDHLRLRMDVDGNIAGRFMILNGTTGDTVLRVSEDSTWRAFGSGTGTKLTLSDSILAATMRISGLTASRLMATNAGSTAASVADLTAWVAGTANQITSTSDGDGSITLSIPNGFTLPSASPTFTGLTLSGLSSGRIPVVSASGLITQDNLYWDATNDRLGIGATSPARTLHVTASSGDVAQRINASTGYTAYNEYTENNSTTAGNYWQIGKEATTNRLFFFNGSTRLEITSAGAVTIPGTLGVTGAASTGALTATTITLGGGESFVYGDTSFTLTATGMTTSPTGTAYAVKVGNAITLTIPYITGTSNSTGFTLTGLPTGWRPTRAVNLPYSGYIDAGVSAPLGFLIILTNGTITLGTSTSTAGWTNSGTKAIGQSILPQDVCVSYQIQ